VSAAHIAAAVAAVLIAAGATWRRRQLSGERKLLAAALVVVLAVYASGVLSALPDPKKAITDIAQALGPWTYALVALAAYLETAAFVGLVAPGETIVIAAGVIAGQGEIQLIPLIGLVWLCATLGDTTSFYIGRRLGRRFLEQHGPKVKITHERLEQVERYFDRYGGRTILIGRFIGLVRALAPFVAGSSGLAYRRFIPYSIVGTGLWSTIFCLLGYLFWRSFDKVASIAGHAIFGFGLTVGVIVAVVVAYKRRREIRAWLLVHQRHPLLRPLFAIGRPVNRYVVRPVVAVVAPPLRFLWNRVTPGELGLQLTTALAVAGVGFYVFVLYVVILSGDSGPTPLDRQLLSLGDDIRSQGLTDLVKVVSDLGSLTVCAAVVGLTAVALAVGRRPAALVAMVAGFVLIYAVVHVTKGAIDRPRPPRPLTDTSGWSFPSAHAAYATAWVAATFVLTRRFRLLGGVALMTIAIVLVAAIGLSRIYLHAHYWSDVAGGWGIGFGIYGALAVILMIVDYIRHNMEERAPEPVARAER
jgi:membrane protein DedA with SNARE-associated domain/membrane-associated phospholipid phosphatase